MTPAVTVVIVNYRTPGLARRCAQTALDRIDVPCEIRIVDTSAGPGAIAAPPPGVICHYMRNVGYAAAVNRGMRNTNSPIVVACNADVEFPPDGIQPLLQLFHREPDLAVLGPRQVTPDGRIAHAGIRVAGDSSGGRGYGDPDRGQYLEELEPCAQVSGSVMFLRRDAVEQLGGIPETQLYFEDALLCHRAWKAGWIVGYTGVRTFVHHVAASPSPDGASRAMLAGASRATFEAELAA
jgi:N-acetylglucosaminyl-diphospho-decaprenol L-rhamnosyltransferase